ncbi:MAG: hypothetical protein JKY93_00525 [Gammaproteobacteria bacterium]|nr:hypothetical protein [Gammaproteobacteria bacterium]
MAVLTIQQQLESVQTAISRIEGGVQSYTMPDGQQATRANLNDLYNREQRLMIRYRREQRGGINIGTGIKK